MAEQIGYCVVGTIKSIQGHCGRGHKVGDRLELSSHDSGGLCGFFYHNIFPQLTMLQFGGSFPADWGDPDVLLQDCSDRVNKVTIELRRMR